MQDLVAEYQQYQDATYVYLFHLGLFFKVMIFCYSAEEEGEYEEEVAGEEEQ